MLEIVERYGVEALKAATAQVQEEVEETMRGRLAQIPDGEWYDHVYLDHDGIGYELYEVKLKLTKRGGKLIFDFTGTSPEAPGMINGTISGLRGGVMTAVLVMLGYEMPWSTGGLRNIVEIVAEPGTINNCDYPAPCSGGSVCAEEATENVAGTVVGKMLGASAALRDESMTVWYPYFNLVILAGLDQYGEPLASLMFDNSAGGGGRAALGRRGRLRRLLRVGLLRLPERRVQREDLPGARALPPAGAGQLRPRPHPRRHRDRAGHDQLRRRGRPRSDRDHARGGPARRSRPLRRLPLRAQHQRDPARRRHPRPARARRR